MTSNNNYLYQKHAQKAQSSCYRSYKLFYFLSIIIIVSLLFKNSFSMMEQRLTDQQKQLIRSQQHKVRQQVNISQQSVQSFTFQSKGYQAFQISVISSQVIKGQAFVYWNVDNVFISSDVKQGQEIALQIFQDENMISTRLFYTMTAFMFSAQNNKKYTIKIITSGGNITKLLAMTISKIIPAKQQNLLNANQTQSYSQRVNSMIPHFSNYVKDLTTTHYFNSNLNNHLLRLNQRYFYYQFFELLIVIIAAAIQVFMIKKMLKSNNNII